MPPPTQGWYLACHREIGGGVICFPDLMAHFTLKASLKASHGLRLVAAMPRQNNILLTICQCRGAKLDPHQMKIKKINGQIKSLTIIFTDKTLFSGVHL